MKVAIDTGPITSGHSVRGIGVHTKFLVEYLKKIKGIEVETVDFSNTDLSKYDIVHYPSFNPFFVNLPLTKKTKTVVTIHDLIYLIYPKHYPPGLKGKAKFALNKLLIRNADAIITISETSKKDIVRFLGIDPEKVFVIYLAPNPIYRKIKDRNLLTSVAKKYKLPKNFVLYVGDVNYNKNIPGLIKACEIADLSLVIAGKHALGIENKDLSHPELSHLREIVKNFRDDKKIMKLGFVPDEDLVAIYNLATLYCQPSFYEGFGLPILEAFSCETPVVASKIQVHVEIAEGGALFANPKEFQDLASKMKRFLEDEELRKKHSLLGRKIVRNFTWKKTATETFEVYKKIFKKGR